MKKGEKKQRKKRKEKKRKRKLNCRGSNLNRWGVKGGFRVGKLNFFNSIMCYYEKVYIRWKLGRG